MITKQLQRLNNVQEAIIWDGLQADVIKFCFDILSGRLTRDCFNTSFRKLVSNIEDFKPTNSKIKHEKECLLIKVKEMRVSVDFMYNIVGSGADNLRSDDIRNEVNFYIGNIVVS